MNGTYRGVEGNIVPFVAAAAAAGSRTFNIELMLRIPISLSCLLQVITRR